MKFITKKNEQFHIHRIDNMAQRERERKWNRSYNSKEKLSEFLDWKQKKNLSMNGRDRVAEMVKHPNLCCD